MVLILHRTDQIVVRFARNAQVKGTVVKIRNYPFCDSNGTPKIQRDIRQYKIV